MKKTLLMSFVFICLGVSVHADGLIQGCSKEVVDASAQLVTDVTIAVSQGSVAPIDKIKADILESEVRYCSHTESLKVACAEILPLQLEVMKAEQKKWALGASRISDVEREIRTLAAYQAACK